MTNQIIFIDPTVNNYQNLISGISPNAEIVILDANRDGIDQITETLANRSQIAAVHIVSHGNNGSLQLGTGIVNSQTLATVYADSVPQWAASLTPDADIFLYGCNIGATTQGQEFVKCLSEITQADVAASDDLTGSATLNGDWDLEIFTGKIEAETPFSTSATEDYEYVLANYDVTFATDTGNDTVISSLSWAIRQANLNPGADTITLYTNVTVTGVMKNLINSDISFIGNNGSVSGNNAFRPFFVKSGVVSFSNMTVTNGRALGGSSFLGGGGAGMGGGLFIYGGSVTVNNVTFSNNSAVGGNSGQPDLGTGGAGMYGNSGSSGGGGLFASSIIGFGIDSGAYGGNGNYGGGVYSFGGGGFGRFFGSRGGFGGGGGFSTLIGGGYDGGFGGGGGYSSLLPSGGHRGDGGYGGGGGFGNGGFGGDGGFGGGGGSGGFGGGGGAGMGGAIFIRTGSLTLNNATFTGNTATGGTGANSGKGYGGAIFAMKSTTNSNGNNERMPAALPTVTSSAATFTSNNAGDATGNTGTNGIGTNQNNDHVFGTISAGLPTVSITATGTPAEGGATGTYTVTRTNTTGNLTVNFTVGGTATFGAGKDYTMSGATTFNSSKGSIVIPNGQNSVSFNLNALTDAVSEPNETTKLTLAADPNYTINSAQKNASLTITDVVPLPTVSLTPTAIAKTEGNSGTTDYIFTATLSQPTTKNVTVNYTTKDGTATLADNDYIDNDNSITFIAGGSLTQTITVQSKGDNIVESNETFTVNLDNATNAQIDATAKQGISTITNNDTAGITVTQSGGSINITEGGATDTYDIFLTSQPTSDVTIAINNGAQTGTAPNTVTFTSANWNTAQTVTVTATNDNVVEGNHTATISHTATSSDSNYNGISINSITANITDNDSDVNLAISPSSATEDGAANLVYTFTRTGVTFSPLTVNFNVGGTATFNNDYAVSGADTFNGSSGTVTFAANSTTATVTIDPTADSTVEVDKTIQLTLANGSNYNVVTNSAVTGTVTNDDSTVEFSQANYQVNEDGTIIGATVTINRTGFINSAGSVQVQFANGTATGGTDFTNTTQTINFASGDTSKTVTIPITEDTLSEGTENFTLSLVNPSANTTIGSQNTATVQIIDNDIPPTIAISDIAQLEGNSGTTNLEFTISLNTASVQTVTVNYTTQNSTATNADGDYNSASGTLTFNPGETQKTVSIPVNGDTRTESDENFEVKLSNPSNATISDDTGVVTIQNDDANPTISIANAAPQSEGNSGTVTHTFNITLSNASSQNISVNYNTTDGTATTADSDYTATSGNLIFNPGETQKIITVTSNGDNKYETNETFNLNLSNPINATVSNSVAVGTINNDDTIPTVAVADVTQNEGNSSTTNFIFPVTLSNPTYQTVTVNYATANGTASAGVDYNSASGTLTFNPGEVQKNIAVAVNGNTTLELETNKNFLVNLSNPGKATIGDNQAVGTIVNDDAANSAPIVNAVIPVQSTNANSTAFAFTLPNDTFKDVDAGDTLTYSATLPNGNPLPNWLFFNPFTRSFVALPTSSNVGTTVVFVTATDTSNASVSTPFVLVVNGANVPQDPDCFCETFVRPDINNLPNVPKALNPVNNILSGSETNDILVGTPVNDALYGNGGDDLLFGKAANDNLFGGLGNDIAFGEAGNDWLIGEEGNDILCGNTGDDVINGGQSNDTLRGGEGNDFLRGGQDNDLILGDRGNDTLLGDKGNDTIFGDRDAAGSDLIFGGSGDDVLNGNAGNDTIFAEDGNDTLRGGQNDDILCGDAGNDLIYGDLGTDSICGCDGNDTIYGGNGSSANSDRDELCGGAGNDLIFGNEGEDKLNGAEGDDTLYGGKDNDTMIGGAGNDRLIGDLGNDLLTGGSGNDIFVLTLGKGSDVVTDFQNGQDLIGLSSGLSFAQLAIAQTNNNTLISMKDTGELLATLNGIQASLITQQAFIAV